MGFRWYHSIPQASMLIRARTVPILSLVIFAGACSTKEHAATDTAAMAMTPAASSGGAMKTHDSTGNMAGMGGMHADTVVARVKNDLAAMDAASDGAIVPLVPAHRQTVEALIDDCEMMMKEMKMTPPGKWNQAVAALRVDLGTMGTANAASVHAMWPQHKLRVQTMLDMRHDMMKM